MPGAAAARGRDSVRRTKPGDVILLRSIYRGNGRWTFPHRYVGTWDGRHGFYCQPGTEGRLMKRAIGGG